MNSGYPNISAREQGSLKIWGLAVVIAIGLLVILISLQVVEYLYYKEPQSVRPGNATPATQAAMQPLSAGDIADVKKDEDTSKPESAVDTAVKTSDEMRPETASAVETNIVESKEVTNVPASAVETSAIKSDEPTTEPAPVPETGENQ